MGRSTLGSVLELPLNSASDTIRAGNESGSSSVYGGRADLLSLFIKVLGNAKSTSILDAIVLSKKRTFFSFKASNLSGGKGSEGSEFFNNNIGSRGLLEVHLFEAIELERVIILSGLSLSIELFLSLFDDGIKSRNGVLRFGNSLGSNSGSGGLLKLNLLGIVLSSL